jgi:hypothetical protein
MMPGPTGLAVITVSAALVFTKLLDVLSTLRVLAAPQQETNPLAARLMRTLGVRTAVWLVFALACALVGISACLALRGSMVLTVAFCIVGLMVAVVQASVARANFRGRGDAVTRAVLRVHHRIGRLMQSS